MPRLLKNLLFSLLSVLIVFFSVTPYFSVKAQAQNTNPTATWYNEDFQSWASKVYDTSNPSDIFGERYTAAQVQWIIYSLFAFMIKNSGSGGDVLMCILRGQAGGDYADCQEHLENFIKQIEAVNPENLGGQQNTIPYAPDPNQSLAGAIFDTNRSFSGLSYTKNAINKFKLVPEAKAQSAGFGYNTALDPIRSMWSAIRNVAYSLFALVAVIFAFLVMFRIKLSPQTAITVQSALPKIVFAMIAVTFSYAIAGFMVDLMYVVIGLLSVAIAPLAPLGPAQYFGAMTKGVFYMGILGTLIFGGLFYIFPIVLILGITALIISVASGGTAATPSFILAGLITLVIIVIYLWLCIKTMWLLMKTLASFLLTVIFSPITLVLGTFIPTFSLGGWIRTIAAQLAVFVTVGLLSTMSFVFLVQSIVILAENHAWILPLINFISPAFAVGLAIGGTVSPGWPPLLNVGGPYAVAIIMWAVSFVLFTMIPKSAEVVQAMLSGKPIAYGSAVGESFGPLSTLWGYTGGQVLRGTYEVAGKRIGEERVDAAMEWLNKRFPRRKNVDTSN